MSCLVFFVVALLFVLVRCLLLVVRCLLSLLCVVGCCLVLLCIVYCWLSLVVACCLLCTIGCLVLLCWLLIIDLFLFFIFIFLFQNTQSLLPLGAYMPGGVLCLYHTHLPKRIASLYVQKKNDPIWVATYYSNSKSNWKKSSNSVS